MDKMQLSEIFTARDVVHRIRAPYLCHFDRFLTMAIFTGSASTVHNSLKIMFQNFTFGVIQAMIHAYQCCRF